MTSLRDPNRRPTHPGAILRDDVLPALQMTPARFAKRLGVEPAVVISLLEQKSRLTPELATQIEAVLGAANGSWRRMQAAVDLWDEENK